MANQSPAAGPACGRMFAELGATVYKLGPGIPQHGPMVMMVWQVISLPARALMHSRLPSHDAYAYAG